jgi:hypothetical protein
VLPIWTAANAAIKAGRSKSLTKRMSELGVHISTRLNLVPRVIQRINEGTAAVNAAVAARPTGHEFSPDTQAYALRIDKNLKFRLLLDIDSLLFEMNSLYELWCEFFKALHIHAAKKMPAKTANEAIRQVVANGGGSTSWIDELDRERNYFMHRGAPYLAIDVSGAKYDLLFLRSNVIDLNVSNDYVRLSELDSMVRGFREAKPIVGDYLAALYV